MSEIRQETARELMLACEAVRFYFWEPHPDGRPFSPESEVQESLETALSHARADLARVENPSRQLANFTTPQLVGELVARGLSVQIGTPLEVHDGP